MASEQGVLIPQEEIRGTSSLVTFTPNLLYNSRQLAIMCGGSSRFNAMEMAV